jgi:large subunit ribosomal protein L35
MPKFKTHQASAKRFKITKRGKVVRLSQSAQHLVSGKPKRRRRMAKKSVPVVTSEVKKIKALIPNF